ncbi:MAG: cupin domain-containing protein [Lysobacterales bacterium]
MNAGAAAPVQLAEVECRCSDLEATLAFLTGRGGFRIEQIMPADAPSSAVVSVSGLRLHLQQDRAAAQHLEPLSIRLRCAEADLPPAADRVLVGPDRLRLSWVPQFEPLRVPAASKVFQLGRGSDLAAWVVGRAGMQYRDLLPGRLGGAFIASEIRIPDGGPVPDYVHFHRVRFQMIYCKSGWVRVVYEDQGEPFVLSAGDCVLQPPTIRHRVLDASPGLEAIEVGCPAVHATYADHSIALPTERIDAERRFEGQRFVRHMAAAAPWRALANGAFEAQDFGIAAATDGLAQVRALRVAAGHGVATPAGLTLRHQGDFLFLYLLEGSARLQAAASGSASEPVVETLYRDDCCVLPAGQDWQLQADPDLRLLEVRVAKA